MKEIAIFRQMAGLEFEDNKFIAIIASDGTHYIVPVDLRGELNKLSYSKFATIPLHPDHTQEIQPNAALRTELSSVDEDFPVRCVFVLTKLGDTISALSAADFSQSNRPVEPVRKMPLTVPAALPKATSVPHSTAPHTPVKPTVSPFEASLSELRFVFSVHKYPQLAPGMTEAVSHLGNGENFETNKASLVNTLVTALTPAYRGGCDTIIKPVLSALGTLDGEASSLVTKAFQQVVATETSFERTRLLLQEYIAGKEQGGSKMPGPEAGM